ncbi:MAG TPA: hypothetical protein VGI10_24725 [Polyangiaceae bacterium]|jgi:hypothetical protein
MEHLQGSQREARTLGITLIGRTLSARADWVRFSLFRDNVQHHLEGGLPSSDYSELHSIALAIEGHDLSLSARQLRRQVLRARAALSELSGDEIAISIRTRAILTGARELPCVHGTVLASAVGWEPSLPEVWVKRFSQLCAPFVNAVLDVTEAASAEDTVLVRIARRLPWFS